MNPATYLTLQDLVKGWTHKEINVSSLYKNEDTGFCIQVICDEETADYVRLFRDNKTVATKCSTLADYSDWQSFMDGYIPNPVIPLNAVEPDSDLPF